MLVMKLRLACNSWNTVCTVQQLKHCLYCATVETLSVQCNSWNTVCTMQQLKHCLYSATVEALSVPCNSWNTVCTVQQLKHCTVQQLKHRLYHATVETLSVQCNSWNTVCAVQQLKHCPYSVRTASYFISHITSCLYLLPGTLVYSHHHIWLWSTHTFQYQSDVQFGHVTCCLERTLWPHTASR